MVISWFFTVVGGTVGLEHVYIGRGFVTKNPGDLQLLVMHPGAVIWSIIHVYLLHNQW